MGHRRAEPSEVTVTATLPELENAANMTVDSSFCRVDARLPSDDGATFSRRISEPTYAIGWHHQTTRQNTSKGPHELP